MYKFWAFLNRMKYIKRWSLMHSTQTENIMEHSWQVATVAHALVLINNKIFNGTADEKTVVLYAQYHETGEVITGDLPTPIKYFNPEITGAYKDLEKKACERLLKMLPAELENSYKSYIFPDKNSYEAKFVKAADRISAYLKCVDELKSGNKEYKKASASIKAELNKSELKEVEYFMKNIAPAYELTLDELD
ncbi:MAG: 5'-deoxynucleotidase [Clostridia bacterium]|nr:5'-deoxynucleotidase [Clostridia bacterium]